MSGGALVEWLRAQELVLDVDRPPCEWSAESCWGASASSITVGRKIGKEAFAPTRNEAVGHPWCGLVGKELAAVYVPRHHPSVTRSARRHSARAPRSAAVQPRVPGQAASVGTIGVGKEACKRSASKDSARPADCWMCLISQKHLSRISQKQLTSGQIAWYVSQNFVSNSNCDWYFPHTTRHTHPYGARRTQRRRL